MMGTNDDTLGSFPFHRTTGYCKHLNDEIRLSTDLVDRYKWYHLRYTTHKKSVSQIVQETTIVTPYAAVSPKNFCISC